MPWIASEFRPEGKRVKANEPNRCRLRINKLIYEGYLDESSSLEMHANYRWHFNSDKQRINVIMLNYIMITRQNENSIFLFSSNYTNGKLPSKVAWYASQNLFALCTFCSFYLACYFPVNRMFSWKKGQRNPPYTTLYRYLLMLAYVHWALAERVIRLHIRVVNKVKMVGGKHVAPIHGQWKTRWYEEEDEKHPTTGLKLQHQSAFIAYRSCRISL